MAVQRAAVVRDGRILNVIVASLSDDPPEGGVLIELPEGSPVGIGWLWDGEVFIDPNPPEEDD